MYSACLTKVRFDWVFVDEAQDLNEAQIAVMMRVIKAKPTCRVIIVGDPHQAIYGFRGAASGSMDQLRTALEAQGKVTRLPLNTTRRCPPSHVELAKKIVPQITALDSKKEGKWTHISIEVFSSAGLKEGDLVICRRNKPIVKLCYEVIKSQRKALIIGEEDVAKDMIQVISKCGNDLLGSLNQFETTELKYMRLRRLWTRMPFITDFYKCLRFLAKSVR
jgi:hypothetical protein